MLLIYTLECLYSLSSLGERSCNLIVNNHGVVDTLVSLVTVEGKSYGPKACIGMKLVETVSGGGVSASSASQNTTSNTATVGSTASTTSTSSTAAISTSVATAVVKNTVQTTPARSMPIAPRLIASASQSTSSTTTGESSYFFFFKIDYKMSILQWQCQR